MLFLKTVKEMKITVILTIILTLLWSIVNVAMAFVTSFITDAIAENTHSMREVAYITIAYIVIFGITYLAWVFVSIKFSYKIKRKIRSVLSKHYSNNPKANVSDVQNSYTQELDVLMSNYFNRIPTILYILATFIFALIYAITISPILVIFMIILVGINVSTNQFFTKKLANNMEKLQDDNRNLIKIINGIIPSIFDLKLYKSEKFGETLLEKGSNKQLDSWLKQRKYNETVNAYNFNFLSILWRGTTLISLYLFSRNYMTWGEIFAIGMLTHYIFSPVNQLLEIRNSIVSTNSFRKKFLSLFYEDDESVSSIEIEEISFNEVSFHYESENKRMILEDVNLTFKKYNM